MPLPDERPRASVANLIGRFETQTKRLSVSAGTPSRSNSVVSHITGDSSREEIKEKREWPPKSAVDKEKEKAPPTSYRPIPPAVTTQPATPKDADVDEVPLTAKALSSSMMQAKVEPNAFLENWRKDLPEPTEMVPEPATAATVPATGKPADTQATPTPASTSNFASSQPPRTPLTKTPVAKTSAPTKSSSATPARPTAKPTSAKSPAPKSALSHSVSQPLKPQATGQSISSTTASVRRAAAKTPTTPHPKTPARSEAASRAKTPTSARPKTPSTGLFAPTAASLAKARNAPPAVPQSVKKATISSSSMERLSKPTTASLNRARAAPAVGTSTTKLPATPPRGSAAKAKSAVSPSPSRTKPANAKKEGIVATAAGGGVVAATIAAVGVAAEEAAAEDTNGHSVDVFSSEPDHEPEQSVQEPDVVVEEASDEAEAPAHEDPEPEDVSGDAQVPEVADNDVTPRSPSPLSPVQAIISEPQTDESDLNEEPHADEPIEPPTQKDDLEDIVNLLETVSVTKPAPSTDDLLEIPDVEEAN